MKALLAFLLVWGQALYNWPEVARTVALTFWLEGRRTRAVVSLVLAFVFWIPGSAVSAYLWLRQLRIR